MVLITHTDVIGQVRRAVLSVFRLDTNGFANGACYGYACMFIEAFHENKLEAFYARFAGTLKESPAERNRFFANLGFHQAPYLFPDRFPPGINSNIQNIATTSKMKIKGGVVVPWTHSGAFNIDGMIAALEVFIGLANRHSCRFAFLLDGGRHTIALALERDLAIISTVENPREQLRYSIKRDNIKLLALHLLEYISKDQIDEEDRLIVNWSWVPCVDEFEYCEKILPELRRDPVFNYIPSKDLLSVPDIKNRRWIIGAVRAQDEQMIQSMIQQVPPLKDLVELDKSLLTYCAYFGLLKSAKALLEVELDPNKPDPEGNFPLHLAVSNAQVQFAALLLHYHADINKENRAGESPLCFAYRELAEKKDNPPLQAIVSLMKNSTHSQTRL